MATKKARWKLKNSSGQVGIPQEGIEWLQTLQREEEILNMGVTEDGKYFEVTMKDPSKEIEEANNKNNEK